MPYTLNGIGTHYYGSKNRSARIDVCESCGKTATLSSYDTREFFCVLFIPLIPLRKFRILNDCSSCRRHQRISAGDFTNQVNAATAPLRDAIRRSPREPRPYAELVQALIGWEMRTEAERELQSALSLFPSNVDLLLLSAQLASDRNEWEQSLSLYERVARIDPANVAAIYGRGWLLHHLERHEEAIPLLQRASTQDFNQQGALYLLGVSNMKLSRWTDALNAFQQLMGLEPAWDQDKEFLRLMRECKTEMGWQLTDAERRAGRRWFSRKSKRARLQSGPTLARPGFVVAGVALLVLIAVAFGVTMFDEKNNIPLYVENGLDRPVRIDLDGRQFDMARQSSRKEQLKAGQHTIIVREKSGAEIERHAFDLAEQSLFEVALHDRFFVYNVAGENVYRRAVHGYAARPENATYEEHLIAMQRFFEQRDVDYPFRNPPETVELSTTSSVKKKVSFNNATDIDLATWAMMQLQSGKLDEARPAMERAIANRPCHTTTRQQQVQFAGLVSSVDAASEAARRWIADCSNDLEAHRAYQNVSMEAGRHAALRAEYRTRLASDDSAAAHYLYGRVLSDSQQAAAEYRRAIQRDPTMPWPHLALAQTYGEMDRHEEQMKELSAALDLAGRDEATVMYYAMASIANGTPDAAVAKVEEIRKRNPRDYLAIDARWLLAVAAADWMTARHMQKLLEPAEGPDAAWWRNMKMMRLKGEDVDAELDRAMADPNRVRIATDIRADRFIEKGEFGKCAQFVEQNAKHLDPVSAATTLGFAAGGLMMRGNNQEAMQLLNRAETMLIDEPEGRPKRIVMSLIEGLRGTKAVAEVIESTGEDNVLAYGWFVAAVRSAARNDRKGAADALARCMRQASDLDFPYLQAKAMAASLMKR